MLQGALFSKSSKCNN